MANRLQRLAETGELTDVQRTTLSVDVLGRYVCNSLQEALDTTDTNGRSDARPFDIIVIGGGTFGAAIAEHLWFVNSQRSDPDHGHRILVLEGGPFSIPEHVQNLPMLGLGNAGPTTLEALAGMTPEEQRRWEKVVWGLAWHANAPFPGLAYCVGGRSLYWGGWSPRQLPGELPPQRWPAETVGDLNAKYFDDASRQIGVTATNDFIFGELHRVLRERLFDGIDHDGVTEAIPLAELPVVLENVPPGEEDISKLEAPLAVQGNPPRAGFFPFNKFSAVPLLTKAARAAQNESNNDDFRKRLMIVPNCHVTRLQTEADGDLARVQEVQTNLGNVPVPPGGAVVIALGTIESTRLALLSFGGVPGVVHPQFGRNLMAHLRSNLNIRIPRQSLTGHASLPDELSTSALFVKCRHDFGDGTFGHYHLQITASGLGAAGGGSEEELFKKVPDIDGFERFLAADDSHVVITIRGIGEMTPDNPESHVTLDGNPARVDEFGQRRAFVSIAQPYEPRPGESPQSAKDRQLWEAMDVASDQIARIFANGQEFEVLTSGGPVTVAHDADLRPVLPYTRGRRDGMGTTHHETGTLRMGADPDTSATDAFGRFHRVTNAYAVGPAVLPTIGSPNPMLSGIALTRRTADHLLGAASFQVEEGFQSLFDGTLGSFRRWQSVGAGRFALHNGAIVAQPGGDLGLLWLPQAQFEDFVLRLQIRLDDPNDNSGVFVRFRDPRLSVPDRFDPLRSYPYNNPAWVPVTTGYELQIDEQARPDGLDQHRSGAWYDVAVGPSAGQQVYQRGAALVPGQWFDLEIEVRGDTYTARLQSQQTSVFTNADAYRGKPVSVDPDSGYIGLQAHTGGVSFRNLRINTAVAPTSRTERRTRRAVAVGAP